ncbi:MAG: hypothetical protein GEV11_01060 [Streptosporangiales bacterium]|nr:hypothetical protein [Streptosporangiales bacterium]
MDERQESGGDPYGTAVLRRRVLDAWAAAPARFREDANAEEDYALGGYRDRVIVELAQNAADAAVRAGEPGRLLLRFDGRTLRAANTGAPLTADGVEALSTLRASAKRDSGAVTVGRFGVGFAAVAAVSDEPVIASAAGAVGWSRHRTRAAVEALPALAGELTHRGGHVPLLRLPFPAAAEPPQGFTTEVVLPLRDADAAVLVRRVLEETGPALLLALPALRTVEIDTEGTLRTLTATHQPAPAPDPATGAEAGPAAREVGVVAIESGGVVSRWRIREEVGTAGAELLADRPAEERGRPEWSVRWAFPVDAAGAPVPLPAGVSSVLHAPTPSDEPIGLPALLLATFPLAPDRRHVAPGPLTDLLLERAGAAYAAALPGVPPVPSLLDLVPTRAAAGELDARLRRTILTALADTAFLPAATPPSSAPGPRSGEAERLRSRDAVAVEGGTELVGVLGDVLRGLLPAAFPVRHPALATLGVRRLAPADLVDLLADLNRDPAWWRGLYGALDPGAADALGALPVPLADGRTVRGPRGLLLPEEGLHPAKLEPLGLRIVHPDAVHPLLARLGAVPGTPSGVLDDPLTRAAAEHSYDAEEPEPIAEAVLDLAAAAGSAPGDRPWLADLALRGADGELYPAGELVFPDGPLATVIEEDSPFGAVDPALVERYGTETLEAAGVLRTFALVRAEDVTEPDFQLDDEDAWWEWVLDRLPDAGLPPVLPEFIAVRDLELVDPARWPQALDLLAEPPLREALLEPARVLLGDGRRVEVPSYTAWWLGEHALLGGSTPSGLRTADADPLLHGLYDPAPDDLDPRLAAVLGVRTSLDRLLNDPSGPDDLVARLADPTRTVTAEHLHSLWTALADADPGAVTPPDRVRALDAGEPAVVDAADAIVVDAPDLVPLLGGSPLIPVPAEVAERLAEVLGLTLAREEVPGEVTSDGARRPVPEAVRRLLPEAPESYVAHDELLVDGVPVPWRYTGGEVHASGTQGLARGLAWAADRWADRHLLAAVLDDPARADDLLLERLF